MTIASRIGEAASSRREQRREAKRREIDGKSGRSMPLPRDYREGADPWVISADLEDPGSLLMVRRKAPFGALSGKSVCQTKTPLPEPLALTRCYHMHGLPHSTKPPSLPSDLDLEVYTEATRRALYDIAVAVHFTASAEIARGDWYPDYSPDQAGLAVHFWRGR